MSGPWVQSLSHDQQTVVQERKSAAGWINSYTLSNGYVLYEKRYATLSTNMISEVQLHISPTTTATDVHPMVPLPPPLSQIPPIPPIINTNHSQARAAFGRQGSRTPHQSTDNSEGHILSISINGHSYNGSIFDVNRTQLA